jgi:LAO/AO transport system kinase
MDHQLIQQLHSGDVRALARAISWIENEQKGYEDLLRGLNTDNASNIIGITGPPGAGKSTLADAMVGELIAAGKKVAVVCVDPSSPFNLGALLGDRIRMSEWYSHPNVFIRSLATRGSVGGLSPKIIEIIAVIRSAGFDNIIVETVGVGQSEIEIAGLADTTIVVVVPESGDEIQTMKAGLMEIADIFVINKSDRPDADLFQRNLRLMMPAPSQAAVQQTPIIKTIATEKKGIGELMTAIENCLGQDTNSDRHLALLTEKAWQLLVQKKMKEVSKNELKQLIREEYKKQNFNLYSLVDKF